MNIRKVVIGALIVCPLAFAAEKKAKSKDSARAEEISRFYAEAPIERVEFSIKPAAIQQLRDDPRVYTEVKMMSGGKEWSGVALKLKGSDGSFKTVDDKPALTVDFDKFKGAERFHSQKKIHLNNGNEDPSFLREWLAGEMALAAGIPAGRCTHAFVSINGKDKGLYVLRESFTKDFLAANFGLKNGALFEGHFCKDIDEELELDIGEESARKALRELIAACREADPAKRWENLGAVLDLKKYARFLAFESLISYGDSYDYYKNNYRLYLDAKTGKFSFVAHGMDQVLGSPEESIHRTPISMVGGIFWNHPEGRRMYREQISELYEKVLVAGDWPARVEAKAKVVEAAMKAHGSKRVKEFITRSEALRGDVMKRVESVGAQLAEWPEPLSFDAKGVAPLPKEWRTDADGGDAEHEEGEVGGKPALRIAAREPSVASWRRSVSLDAGKYRFEASARAKKLKPAEDEKGRGAGLRISGAESRRSNELAGDADWTVLGYEFEVNEPRDVVLVAELRATSGEVWFARDSLKIVKLK